MRLCVSTVLCVLALIVCMYDGNSAGQNRRHAADVLTVVDAVTTPTLPTLPILIPTQALDNMDTFLQRKQVMYYRVAVVGVVGVAP